MRREWEKGEVRHARGSSGQTPSVSAARTQMQVVQGQERWGVHWSREGLWMHTDTAENNSSCPASCCTTHWPPGIIFFSVLQLSLKLAIEKKQRHLWVFFSFAPQRQNMWLFIQTPYSLRKAVHREWGHSKLCIPFCPALHYLPLALTTSLLLAEGRMQLRDCFLYALLTPRFLPCNKTCFLLLGHCLPKPSKASNVMHPHPRSDIQQKDFLRSRSYIPLNMYSCLFFMNPNNKSIFDKTPSMEIFKP